MFVMKWFSMAKLFSGIFILFFFFSINPHGKKIMFQLYNENIDFFRGSKM